MINNSAWWRETSIYQIYPRSFADSNGDGIGDLPGILDRLDYIKDLGFETIWLSPHFTSPQRDFGYDVADYYNVASEYGSLDDAQRLIEEVHQRDMKIIFDMVLNHTSDQHPWFLESRSSRDNPLRNWYIWRDGRGNLPGENPPNNWLALPGGSGWEYDPATQQWYFHNFLPFQPDLNWRNPDVKTAMFDVMRFWLDCGVDGFRLDIFHSIYKDAQFRNNPFSWRFIPTEDFDAAFFQKQAYNLNLPETFALAKEVRTLIDAYTPVRFVIGEVFGKGVVKKYLGEQHDGLNLILQFELASLNRAKAKDIKAILHSIESKYPPPYTPTYALGNHDLRRYISRIGGDKALARLLAFFLYTARGIPINYYGDELGIPDGDFPLKGARDSVAHRFRLLPTWVPRLLNVYINRDGCRTPMQWDNSPHAGFARNTAVPWLPLHSSYPTCNVAFQQADEYSILNTHRKLLHLRREHASLRRGTLVLLPDEALPAEVVGYDRTLDSDTLRVLLNFSREEQIVGLGGDFHQVLARSDAACNINGHQVTLSPRGSVLLLK